MSVAILTGQIEIRQTDSMHGSAFVADQGSSSRGRAVYVQTVQDMI